MLQTTAKNILLTGLPGCGKTTVVRRVVELLKARRLAGFYTQEIREHGQRMGFEATGLGGGRAILAHVDFHTGHRVGRYGVDLSHFEAIVRTELNREPGEVDLFIVDEIGKMECLSPVFVEAVTRILDGPVPVLATIAARGGGFIAHAKARSDVQITAITTANRDGVPGELTRRIQSR